MKTVLVASALMAMSLSVGADVSQPSPQPMECDFAFKLHGDDPTGSSRVCGGYEFRLDLHPYQTHQSALSVSPASSRDRTLLAYTLGQLPPSEVVLLADHSNRPSNILARRTETHLSIIVTRGPVTQKVPQIWVRSLR